MKNLSTVKQRIMEYLKYKGISNVKYYELSGVSNGVLSQNNGLSEDGLLRFLSTFPEVSPDWLLLGKGEMLRKREGDLCPNCIGKDKKILELQDQVIELQRQLLAANSPVDVHQKATA